MDEEINALKSVRDDLRKIKERYQKKANKEREKINDIYVTVCGEKCYTEDEINEWYGCDYINLTQCEKYIEKLKSKQTKAGSVNDSTKSERMNKILENIIYNISLEIKDIEYKKEQEIKKQERWEIAQKQGMNYKEFLELEEISRQSEEYEILMGIKK